MQERVKDPNPNRTDLGQLNTSWDIYFKSALQELKTKLGLFPDLITGLNVRPGAGHQWVRSRYGSTNSRPDCGPDLEQNEVLSGPRLKRYFKNV